jgi:DNA topoisomerase-1
VPTEMGEKVVDELLKFFPDIFDYRFTAKMEEELDKIEEGEKGYLDVVKEFYLELWPKIERANGSLS